MEDDNKMTMKAETSKKGAAINPILSLSPAEVEITTENVPRSFFPSCKSCTSLCTTYCQSVSSWGEWVLQNGPPASERE